MTAMATVAAVVCGFTPSGDEYPSKVTPSSRLPRASATRNHQPEYRAGMPLRARANRRALRGPSARGKESGEHEEGDRPHR